MKRKSPKGFVVAGGGFKPQVVPTRRDAQAVANVRKKLVRLQQEVAPKFARIQQEAARVQARIRRRR